MSYIRAGSNPEGMYVYWSRAADRRHVVCIHYTPNGKLTRGDTIVVPKTVFMDVVRAWNGGHRKVRRGLFAVEERFVVMGTGREPPKSYFDQLLAYMAKRRKTRPPVAEYQVKFSYKGNFVHMWPVTWMYIVNNALPDALFGDGRKKCR